MVDLHAHVLPGVDDGPATLADAVMMCRQATADGVDVIVATAHQRTEEFLNDDLALLEQKRAELQNAVGDEPGILLGGEIRVDCGLLAEVDRLPGGTLLPLAGTRHLLIDFGFGELGPGPREIVRELMLAGWVPVVAHPERLPYLADDIELMHDLVERGALLQITAMGITGGFGRLVRDCCRLMIEESLVHLVASDAHDPRHRPPVLSEAYRAIAEEWGEETARRLVVENPWSVIRQREPAEAGARQ